ncbi:hypothetical protein T265_05945 [Opisthorchis viverrini]|uniref:Uncharacterized protein n=1 Tax=Opisthorchis viverrini TaxID=6198 RepID=A0A074ZHW6_OPIVI|nr:hypothetical protein T265_05945 [Opisthorchis viverrini]KER26888.1 hypothetical protein T265_05945 [Opisthorchis viverrini]
MVVRDATYSASGETGQSMRHWVSSQFGKLLDCRCRAHNGVHQLLRCSINLSLYVGREAGQSDRSARMNTANTGKDRNSSHASPMTSAR